jgi:5'(3')-deoxyribonucleotidase
MMKKPGDFIVFIDMDNVLENFTQLWVRILNVKYRTSVRYDKMKSYDIHKYYPNLSDKQIFEPLNVPEFYYAMEPTPWAYDYLKALMKEGFQIYVLSKSYYKITKFKVEFIQYYFPFLGWQQFISSCNKQLLTGDVLVDDYPGNLINGHYQGILYSAPWNRENKDFPIANDFSEIYQIIHELFRKKQCPAFTIYTRRQGKLPPFLMQH